MPPALLPLLLMAIAALSACSNSSTAAKPAGDPPQVVTQKVTLQTIPLEVMLPGRTVATQIAEVRPQVGGVVQQRLFQEGSFVKAGQALYQIEPARYQAAVDSAQAQVAKAEATVASSQNRASRLQELVGIEAVSKQERDDAQAAYLQAKADLLAAKAALQTAKLNLDYAQVRAPLSGQIGRSNTSVGALAAVGQTSPMATIVQLDPMWVDLTQSSTELLKLKQSLQQGKLKSVQASSVKVKLQLEDGSTYPIDGTLQFSEVQVNPDTGAVTVRAQFPNPKGSLLPGMYVKALVPQAQQPDVILVPQRAVGRNNKGEPTALVLKSDNKVELRTLKAEATYGSQWVVTQGLQEGDQLIVEGQQKVKPGGTAQVAPPKEENKPTAPTTNKPAAGQ